MGIKVYRALNVLAAATQRIAFAFEHTERVYIGFSGGKDSTVLMHLVMREAIARQRIVGVLFIDFEAQYADTIAHAEEMFARYRDYIEPHWICIPMLLRNAVSQYQPRWTCWDPQARDLWIREKPTEHQSEAAYPFAAPEMEFEEFVVLFGEWYGQGKPTAAFIGIRAQESLHRYCAIATWEKRGLTLRGQRWTTRIIDHVYNAYPLYDWTVEDIWRFHAMHPELPHNRIYDKMQMAGVPLSQQRLCQPYGDDQRRGLWLYHVLEPHTWAKLLYRVNGANAGALFVQERGNASGQQEITCPPGHTWQSFCNLLLSSLPGPTRLHYLVRFKKFIHGWHRRGYAVIPEEAPRELEAKCWAPSWRRMCKVLLRNDWWCHGLGQAQPRSAAYERYKALKRSRKHDAAIAAMGVAMDSLPKVRSEY